MESSKVSSICMHLMEKVDTLGMASIKSSIEKMDDRQYDVVLAAIYQLKDPSTVLLFSIFLGHFGVDRFMLGKVGSGVCKLLFGWLTLGIWWLVDVIKARDNTMRYNLVKMQQALTAISA